MRGKKLFEFTVIGNVNTKLNSNSMDYFDRMETLFSTLPKSINSCKKISIDAKFWISKGTSGISGFEFHHHLNTLLNRVDKMSMAHSVEVRVPFLDYKLAVLGS